MAVSVNTVYQTVLYILNKEQRGYVTPSEFNSIADLVQKEIFESYFPNGNQTNRQTQNNTQNDTEFFNMYKDIAYKLHPFEEEVTFTYNNLEDCYYNSTGLDIYKIGEVISNYSGQPKKSSITQLVSKKDFDKITRSKLTAPTKQHPIFYTTNVPSGGVITNLISGGSNYVLIPPTGATTTSGNGTGMTVGNIVLNSGSIVSFDIINFGTGYVNGDIVTISGGGLPGLGGQATFSVTVSGSGLSTLGLKISPSPSATNDSVVVNCLLNPTPPNWSFTIGSVGQYIFTPVSANSSSVDFELDISEQSNLITRILKYFGVVINDPTIIQVASEEEQATEVNLKS